MIFISLGLNIVIDLYFLTFILLLMIKLVYDFSADFLFDLLFIFKDFLLFLLHFLFAYFCNRSRCKIGVSLAYKLGFMDKLFGLLSLYVAYHQDLQSIQMCLSM